MDDKRLWEIRKELSRNGGKYLFIQPILPYLDEIKKNMQKTWKGRMKLKWWGFRLRLNDWFEKNYYY